MQEHATVPKWDMKVLRDLAQISYGRDAKPILDPHGAYPVYGTAESNRFGTSYLYDGDSVVLGRKGTIDRVQFVTGQFWTIDTAYFLSKFSESEPKWLYYALSAVDLRSLNEATGVPSLAREALYRLPILTPPAPEQSKIAEVLSTVDRAIAQTEALIAKQQRIKTGLMQDLLTRGIDERGQLRSEATNTFKDSLVGRTPVEWEVIDFGDAGQWFSGGTPSKANDRFWNGGVSWICPKDMKQLELTSSIETITHYAVAAGVRLMPAGTVFIVIRGMILAHTFPVGYATCAMAFNQDMKAIVAKEGLSGRYLAYWLMSQQHEFLKLTTTATHGTKRFDTDELSAVPMRLPDLREQEAILQILDKQQSLINDAQDRSEKLRHLKTALMQDLLTGKVRVTPLLQQAKEAIT
jgi:type I restriction enzyme S subunit